MPWICGECGAEGLDSALVCAACERPKTSWTLAAEVTRVFVVGRGLEVLRAQPDRGGALTVRLEVDPAAPVAADDRFVLFSPRGDFAAQVRTVADDAMEGDAFTDLAFEGLDRSLAYSLEVDPGAQGQPYLVFDDTPFAQLVGAPAGARPEPAWEQAEVAWVSDKGLVRDLAARGAPPSPQRLLRLRGTKGKPVTVTIVYATQPARDVELTGEGDTIDLLCVFGPGDLGDLRLPGAQLLDVSEETEQGWAVGLEVSQGGKRPREVRLEGPPGGRLYLRLEIDPDDPEAADDRFYLSSPRGAFATQMKTVRDDLTPDDDTTDLVFLGLDEQASYTLTVDPGGHGEPYTIFEDVPYAELVARPAAGPHAGGA